MIRFGTNHDDSRNEPYLGVGGQIGFEVESRCMIRDESWVPIIVIRDESWVV